MTVYVDDMCETDMGKFRGMKMSHMFADIEDELHVMADKIGVARRWYQGDHYDIAMSKRRLAIIEGAVSITLRQAGAMMALKRMGQPMGFPATASERLIAFREERKLKNIKS